MSAGAEPQTGREAYPEWRPRDARQVLDGLERVALGAGDALDLRGGERLLDRLDDGALPAHGGGVALLDVDEQAQLGGLPFVQRDRDVDRENRRATQRQLVLTDRERSEGESSLFVGDGPPLVPRRDGDQRDRAGDRRAITAPAHDPRERHDRGVRRRHPGRGCRRRWTQIGLEHESIAIRNPHRDRMSVGLSRLENKLARCRDRRPVEHLAPFATRRLGHLDRADLAGLVDVEREDDLSRAPRGRRREGGPPPRNERDAVA